MIIESRHPAWTSKPDIYTGFASSFAGGVTLRPGTYRVEYVIGAMEYNTGFGWTVQLSSFGANYFTMLIDGADDAPAPAVQTAASTQLEAWQANFGQTLEVVLTEPATLGIRLLDSPYDDNIAGQPTPLWRLIPLELA